MRKRVFSVLLALCLLLGMFSGCAARKDDDTLTVVCTVFPIYEWARNVVGSVEGIEVILLVGSGTDLHSYQPTTKDMIGMISADLLVYIGGDSETWVEESLKSREGEERMLLNLRDADGVTLRVTSAESIVEEHEHSHGHDQGHDHDRGAVDEHLWLSLSNAVACTEAIVDALCALDPANAGIYESQGLAYTQELLDLDAAYAETVALASEPTLLFADRFPFVYLAEEYGIRYVAAHAGCSSETDATPSTVIHLAEHVDEWDLRTVCVTESSDTSLAKSVIRATKKKDQSIVVLDSMQSVTYTDVEDGETYLGIMEKNRLLLHGIFEKQAKESD